MSHFTVLVIGNDIDTQLEPFAEQDYDEKYGVFKDTEEENLEQFKSKEVDIVILSNGQKFSKYDKQFRVFDPKTMDNNESYPKDSTIIKGKFSDLYSTFEEFMKEWHGEESRDEKTGRYGYWHNPNAKWDWHSVGGRWTGYFKPKAGAVGRLGRSGVFDNKPTEGWVDSIKLKDIDIEGMLEASANDANTTYDKIEEILQGRVYPSWAKILEKHGENIEAARDEFNSHKVVKSFNEAKFYIWGDFYQEFGVDRQDYVQKQKNRTMVPYAVVKDGNWYQKGEMGWWGMSNDEMSQDDWNKKFWEMINSLDPETELTLVDCHI